MSLSEKLKRFRELNARFAELEKEHDSLAKECSDISQAVFSNVQRQLGSHETVVQFTVDGVIWEATSSGSLRIISEIPAVDANFSVE